MTATTCKWHKGCTTTAGWRGYCHPHYHKLYYARRIRCGYVPAAQLRAVIQDHLDRGRTLRSLMVAGATDERVLAAILNGTQRKVRIQSADRIIAVPMRTSNIGCTRRVQALRRIGYALPLIAGHAGVGYGGLKDACQKGEFTDKMAGGIDRAWRELSGIPGPSKAAERRAAAEGCSAPAAWEYLDIDDPDATPEGVTSPPRRLCRWCQRDFKPTTWDRAYCTREHYQLADAERKKDRRARIAARRSATRTGQEAA